MESGDEKEELLKAYTGGWTSSSRTFVSRDRDKIRFLPEMERILRKELDWINKKQPEMQLMAEQAGIDFWNDSYGEGEDWPKEFKEWFFRTLAWDQMCRYIKGMRALREALHDEDTSCWLPLRPLLLLCRQSDARLPLTVGKEGKER